MEEIKEEEVKLEKIKLANATSYSSQIYGGYSFLSSTNLWSPNDIDKLEVLDLDKYHEIVNQCRYYYKRDPIAGTVLNKLVEIGVTELIFDKGNLSANEFRIFEGLQDSLQEFIESCGLEFLISGLIVPEVKYAAATKEMLVDMGIKKYTSLVVPISMWLRDPLTVKINSSMVMDEPSYYVILPEKLVFFIQHEGMYPDGNKDIELYNDLVKYYSEFVIQVRNGNREILLDNDMIQRRKVLSDSAYPIPYLYNSLEALRHKRNLRRMDYAIASRVIGAIQLFKLGNDTYPVTESDTDEVSTSPFQAIKNQMVHSNITKRDIDRVFQLFANHTLTVEWVYPPMEALLNEAKYIEVNEDIFFGLGFPRILTTGETLRTQSSNPEFAVLSPMKTMENMQRALIRIVKKIIREICTANAFKSVPTVRFDKINLNSYGNFVQAMQFLYNTGNISRTSLGKEFGYSFEDELKLKEGEDEIIRASGLEDYQQNKPEEEVTSPNTEQPKEKPEEKKDNKE